VKTETRNFTLFAVVVAALVTLALAATGCGAGSSGSPSPYPSARSTSPSQGGSDRPGAARSARAFAWLRPSPPPRAWRTSRLPDGLARLAYPHRWHSIRSDPGTVSAAVRAGTGRILGYLNATPQQGAETLASWSSFRVDHNGDEGDVNVKPVASAAHLRFRGARGSCVIDTYTSSTGRRYREIACIVAGASATTVVVGAAPPSQWPRQGPAIERAISSFLT
jgi:hypothetical protein